MKRPRKLLLNQIMKPDTYFPPVHGEPSPPRLHIKRLIAALTVLGAAAVVISCATLTRTVVAPPEIPGATFIGSDSCSQCHDNITKDFPSATHARLMAKGPNAASVGCESCHGPGSIHSETGGERNTIINPDRSPETCFQCHLDKRGEFNLPHHHPIEEGKVTCSDCHDPHKGPATRGGALSNAGQNELCFKCHSAQRGPHVYEHEASREGCVTCHNPHGSVNAKMLTARNANLCLKCHFQQQTGASIVIGGFDHGPLLTRGACWTAGCHEAVHGSQVNSSLRF